VITSAFVLPVSVLAVMGGRSPVFDVSSQLLAKSKAILLFALNEKLTEQNVDNKHWRDVVYAVLNRERKLQSELAAVFFFPP
jgi:hypothetical protein